MTVQLSSLRVGAEFDAGKYTAGADQKVAADKAMIASDQMVRASIGETDTKISASGNVVSILARRYVDGQKEAQAFERDLRSLNRQLETGKITIDAAATILVGMNQRLGMNADASLLAAKGQTQLAAAVTTANAQLEGQVTALARAAAAHQAYIAQARADQAAENSRQSAAANQNAYNTTLGVSSPASGNVGASAAVFQAEFDRLEQLARLRAQQAGAIFADEFNAAVVTNSGKSARASMAVFEEAGREADQMAARVAALRAELDPAAAAQNRLNAELAEYSALAAKGAISAEELAQAQTLARSRIPANQNGGGGNRLSGYQLQGLSYQANDVITMALLGAPASQIAFSQGGQILQNLQMGEGGIAGSLSAIKGSAAAAGTALVGTLGTVGLIATGFGVAAVAAGAFYLLTRDRAKSLNDALKDQKQDILDVAGAYDLAKVSADNYNKSRGIYAGASARQGQADLGNAVRSEDIGVLNDLAKFQTSGQVRGGRFGYVASGSYQARSEYSAFSGPIGAFAKDFDYDELAKGVRDITAQNPALQQTGDKILNIAKVGHEAAVALKEGADALARINSRAPSLADSQLGQDYRDQNSAQLTWLQRQQGAALAGIGAKSPEERRQAAMAAEATRPSDDSADVRQFKIASAGAMAYKEALYQLTEAQDQRKRSLDNTLASAKLDVDLIGQSTAATESLRLAAQLEQQVREEAARNNVAVDEAEIARIKQKADEYGKLRAIQQARDTIYSQEQDIALQQAQLGVIGQNTLARDRSIASFKAEQEIRKLGIPLYGAEAEAIRKNTAELSSLAEAQAKANLASDLAFERRQMFRSPDQQQIASRLQSSGLPDDLNSTAAAAIRANQALQQMKDTWQSIFDVASNGVDSVVDALFQGGKSIGDTLRDVGRNFAKLMFDLALTNPLKNWLTGSNLPSIADLGIFPGAVSGKGGGFGGALGGLLGAQKAVASMQVQAASVFINGAPVGGLAGGLGSLLGGQSGSPFQANTTLTDFLTGGGAANQNVIQTRIDQAFGTNGIAQDLIQSRIDQAFGTTSGGLGGIFSPAGGFASATGGAGSALSQMFASAGVTKTGIPLSGIGIDGLTAKVATEYAGRFQGLLNDLKGAGYPITSLGEGGYSFRNVAGTNNLSNHAFGNALDINPRQNPWAVGAKGNFAQYGVDPNALAEKNGLFWGGNWNKSDAMHFQVNKAVDMESTTQSISKLGETASMAASTINVAGVQVSQSLVNAAGGLTNFGSMLSSFMASPGGGGSGWFQNLAGMFGGSGGALNFMSGISPKATADILSGSWGLFAKGAAFSKGSVIPFAQGDTFSTPTRFPMSGGRTGVLGEAGEEAIMPLRRGPDGRLGVAARTPANQNGGGITAAHIEDIVNSIAKKLSFTNKNINLFDPSVVGDYLQTGEGEKIVMNVLRRNGR